MQMPKPIFNCRRDHVELKTPRSRTKCTRNFKGIVLELDNDYSYSSLNNTNVGLLVRNNNGDPFLIIFSSREMLSC